MSMHLSILTSPRDPWGDYGDILVHGMSMHLGRDSSGRILLERTGPYVPPISFPGAGDVVVTGEFRQALETSGLRGIGFRSLVKRRVVELRWERWDRSADEPRKFPESGEPEDYILERPHSPAIAKAMGVLFELDLKPGAQIRRERIAGSTWDSRIVLMSATWTGGDVFRAKGVGYVYVSERGRDWFTAHAGNHVAFRAAEVD